MRIVFLRSNPVNPDPRVEKEIKSLSNIYKDISIICWDRGKNISISGKKHIGNAQINTEKIGVKAEFGAGFKKNIIPLLKFQIKLFFHLSKNKNSYDVIHACDFDTGFIGMIASVLFKKKLVYDIFDYYVDAFNVPNLLRKVIVKLDRLVMKNASTIIVCTEQRIEQINGAKFNNIVVIHNAPVNKHILTKKFNNTARIKIAYIGILQEGRLIEELLDIVKNNNNLELHIAGFGILENQIKKIADMNENIKFYGRVQYNETLEIENNCDILTAIYDPQVSNHKYAAPNKFYEALMLGKPLIVANNTGIDTIITKYKIGEVINYDRNSLELGIKNLISRKSDWNNMKKTMQELYCKKYSWKVMELRLLNAYEDIRDK